MKYSLQNIILEIHNKEDKISSQSKRLIDEAYEMTLYLQDQLVMLPQLATSKTKKFQSDDLSPYLGVF